MKGDKIKHLKSISCCQEHSKFLFHQYFNPQTVCFSTDAENAICKTRHRHTNINTLRYLSANFLQPLVINNPGPAKPSQIRLFEADPEYVCRVYEPVAFSVMVICDILPWILNTLSHINAKNNLYWHSHTLLQTALMHLYTHADTHTRD